MKPFTLKIVTPSRELFNAPVEYVGLPGIEGKFGVLSSHAPFLSILGVGAGNFRAADNKRRTFTITGGYAEVLGDTVTVLARGSEFVEDIDVARAEECRKRAMERLAARADGMDQARAQAALQRALLRINLSRMGIGS